MDTDSTAAIEAAARWLADQRQPPPGLVPLLRRRFDLKPLEAVEAIRAANAIRASAKR